MVAGARTVILLGALFNVVCMLTLGSGAGAAVAAKKKPKSTSTTTKATTAALTVDACKLLTDAEVEAYANSIGGNYKAQLPFREAARTGNRTEPAPDPAKQRFCTWGFDQARGDGSTSDDGHVALTVERLAANQVAGGCSLVASSGVRNLTGIGDQAQTTNSGVVGCVVVRTSYVQDVDHGRRRRRKRNAWRRRHRQHLETARHQSGTRLSAAPVRW